MLALRQGAHAFRPAALDVARGKADEQMRRPVVGLHLVGVEMLRGRVLVGQVGLVLPVQEILRRGGADRAKAARLPVLLVGHALGEDAPVGAIHAALAVPEGQVLRIERSRRDHRRIGHRRPVQTVGGLQREQALGRTGADERLVFCIGRGGGVLVFEDRRVAAIGIHRAHLAAGNDDVVGL